jgi:hypothetical protein
MLIEETHDERARDAFIASLREFTMAELYPRLREHYGTCWRRDMPSGMAPHRTASRACGR